MSNVLIFFVIPVVTILLAIVLQRILRCPILVAATFFAVLLILAFTVLDTTFIIYGIIYTILAYITAIIMQTICNIRNRIRECCENNNDDNNCFCNVFGRIGNNCICDNQNNSCCCRNRNNSCGCNSGRNRCSCGCRNNNNNNNSNGNSNLISGNVLALNDIDANSINDTSTVLVSSNSNFNSNNNCNCNSNCNDNRQNVVLNAEFVPNSNNNGTTGSFRGCYRRRF